MAAPRNGTPVNSAPQQPLRHRWQATGRGAQQRVAAAVGAAHLALLCGLVLWPGTQRVLLETPPLMVSLLFSPAEPARATAHPASQANPAAQAPPAAHVPQAQPTPPAPQGPAPLPATTLPLPGLPSTPTAAAHPAAAPTAPETAPPPAGLTPGVPAPAAQPTASATPLQPPAPNTAPRKRLNPEAVRYRVEPVVEVPRASQRAGESGVVLLRVVVSAQGLPVLVQVHRSSGHTRLDEQAVAAMRQARFRPYLEDGQAIEVEVIAPIEFPLS